MTTPSLHSDALCSNWSAQSSGCHWNVVPSWCARMIAGFDGSNAFIGRHAFTICASPCVGYLFRLLEGIGCLGHHRNSFGRASAASYGLPQGRATTGPLAKPSPSSVRRKACRGVGCRTNHNWEKDRCAASRQRCRQHRWRKVLETDAQHMPVIVAWREPPLRGYSSCLLAISLVPTAIYDIARRGPGGAGFGRNIASHADRIA